MGDSVLIIDGGARGHALALKYLDSPAVDRVVVAPGNEGMVYLSDGTIGIDKGVGLKDAESIVAAAQRVRPDLVDVAQDDALAADSVDRLVEAGFAAFGPSGAAARVESDKWWSRKAQEKYGLPVPVFAAFHIEKLGEARAYALERLQQVPTVFLKASGLYAGKGVLPATAASLDAALAQLPGMGSAAEVFLVEDGLPGEEFSSYAVVDGKDFLLFNSAQDNKRVFDGDEGPNTGGMGAHSPAAITAGYEDFIKQHIFAPIIEGMAREGCAFKGILYFGGVLTADGPKVIEFNARWGDPEAQVVLPGVQNDYYALVRAALDGSLAQHAIQQDDLSRVCVVGASPGYPGDYEIGKKVFLNHPFPEGVQFLSAGIGEDWRTIGGRVVNAVGASRDIVAARDAAYLGIGACTIEGGMHRRGDIASRDVLRLTADEGK